MFDEYNVPVFDFRSISQRGRQVATESSDLVEQDDLFSLETVRLRRTSLG